MTVWHERYMTSKKRDKRRNRKKGMRKQNKIIQEKYGLKSSITRMV